jgi:hypothetical protein
MLPIISMMSTPASLTIETAPVVVWAMLGLFAVASLGVLRAVFVARKRARTEATELELLARLARRVSESSNARYRPLAA